MSAASKSGARLRVAASWCVGLGLASAAAVGPAIAEARLDAQLREQLGVDDSFQIDINLSNIELRSLSRLLPGAHTRVSAEFVRVRPSFEGVFVELEGLQLTREAPPPPASASPEPAERAAPAAPDPRAHPRDPLEQLLERLHGLPIDVRHDGPIELELDGVALRASKLHLELPGDGALRGEGLLSVRTGATELDTKLAFETEAGHARELHLEGALLDERRLPALSFVGQARPTGASFTLDTPAGGRATLEAERASAGGSSFSLRLDALEFPLAPLGTAAAGLLAERASLELSEALVSGSVELDASAEGLRLRLEQLELERLGLQLDLLSAAPVRFEALDIEGELGRSRDHDFGTLLIGHRDVQVQLSGQLDARGLSFDFQLPSSPCQAVLDAAPGMSPVLAGTQLEGQLAAHLGLDLDFEQLAEARADFAADGGASFDLETFDPPGELRFSLPYLESCTVERLGPGIDIEGLRGAYRHDFLTGSGALERRVLAPGDEGFTPIASIPQLALAFVILEDAMFHRHDGFDREQLERAFWFNVLEGRVARGASTISQQTARTLWLGIDRSISRKLGEAMLTAELERGLGKRRILEIYLNLIELGPGIHGVAEAAEYHFGKPAAQLNLAEALHLASLAPAPVTYSRRFASGELDSEWREHLRLQIRRLQLRKLITHEQAQRAMRLDLNLRAH